MPNCRVCLKEQRMSKYIKKNYVNEFVSLMFYGVGMTRFDPQLSRLNE